MAMDDRHSISLEELTFLNSERSRYIQLAVLYVQDRKVAEDIFQDCMLYLLDNREKIFISNIRTYFYSMIKYNCGKYLKKEGQHIKEMIDTGTFVQDHIQRLSSADGAEEDDLARTVDFQELIRKCKSQLPERTFEIFAAKRLEKMSYKKISSVFGISERRINFEISKAQKVLRKEFKDYNIFMIAIAVVVPLLLSEIDTETSPKETHSTSVSLDTAPADSHPGL